MRFGHYTVFDTPAENKHTQVYVEYDVPNNDNLDGATGTIILSDGSSESSDGGDSRFSTCEVEVFFTKDGQPLTLPYGEVCVFNGYTTGHLTNIDDPIKNFPTCYPMLDPDNNIITPLMFEGTAYLSGASGIDGNDNFYTINGNVEPVCTGDISFGTFGNVPAVIIRGNGTITIEMMAD